MLRKITTFFISICLFVLMAAPMTVQATEEMSGSETGEIVSEHETGDTGISESDHGALEEKVLETETGLLRVTKTDEHTGTPLSGATFKVYHAEDGTEAGKLLIGSDGTGQTALPPGEYYLLEQCAPEGYQLSLEKYAVTVAGGEIKDLTVTNKPQGEPEPKAGTIKIKKTDAGKKDKMLSGAVFSIYEEGTGRKVGELMTGKDGTADMELPAGSYIVRETASPEGYVISANTIHISLEAGAVKELAVSNRKEGETESDEESGALRITKRDSESGERLNGAIFGIYETDTDNCMGEITTDRKGVAEIELEPGSYYLLELEAPNGYDLDEEKISFRVRSGKTTEKNIENVKKDTGETENGNMEIQPGGLFDSLFDSLLANPSAIQIPQTAEKDNWDTEEKTAGTLQLINTAAGTGEKLSGQILTIYRSGGKKAGEVTVKNGTGTLVLEEGDYYLRERKSPAGFFGETARIRFSITQGMTTTVEITSERDLESTNPQDIIPKTGGTFPILPAGLSALFFLCAAACGLSLHNRKQKHQ